MSDTREPVLIGVSGAYQSGKDTSIGLARDWSRVHGFRTVTRSFAAPLKQSLMRLFYPEIGELEAVNIANEMKLRGKITLRVKNERLVAQEDAYSDVTITGREALQRHGTEAHREIFGDGFWVDNILPHGEIQHMPEGMEGRNWVLHGWSTPKWHEKFRRADGDMPDFCFISDVRFPNESQRVKDLGGVCWRIVRPGAEGDGHASEAGIPDEHVDYEIQNDGSLDDLRYKVWNIMEALA